MLLLVAALCNCMRAHMGPEGVHQCVFSYEHMHVGACYLQ